MRARLGKITHIQFNLVYILEEGEKGKIYGFMPGQIDGYRGEPLRELKQFGKKGLREGVLVKFYADDEGRVTRVCPLVFKE